MKERKTPTLPEQAATPRSFWPAAGLLAVLVVMVQTRDIDRPYYGLHSWAAASGSWAARCHVKYGWGYTKGVSTWAVGNPPPESPKRYYDHPQLAVNIRALVLLVFGMHEWAPRAYAMVLSLITMVLLMLIVRRLFSPAAAVLAGLFFAVFPITGYFAGTRHPDVMYLAGLWCYLVLIGARGEGPRPGRRHYVILALALFGMLQTSWSGVFYAGTLFLHYGARCIWRRQRPNVPLLVVLVVAPAASLLLTLLIMLAGYGWDFGKIVALFTWRAGKGEMRQFDWGAWFETFWRHALSNFAWGALLLCIGYHVARWVLRWTEKKDTDLPLRFPSLWLFLMPGVFQVFILKGALWKHQTWEMPFVSFVAVSAGLGVLLLWQLLRRADLRLAYGGAGAALAVSVVFCAVGVNDYFVRRWQTPHKIAMLKMLNRTIPPNQALLSFEPFMTDQHSAKGAFYRPEIAWYLDREILQPATIEEVFARLNRPTAENPQVTWAGAARFLIDRIEEYKDKGPVYLLPEYMAYTGRDGRRRSLGLAPLAQALEQKYPRIVTVPAFIPVRPGQVASPAYYVYRVAPAGLAP